MVSLVLKNPTSASFNPVVKQGIYKIFFPGCISSRPKIKLNIKVVLTFEIHILSIKDKNIFYL